MLDLIGLTLYPGLTVAASAKTRIKNLTELLNRVGQEKQIRYDLEHFSRFLESGGSPQKAVKTILIGGTNGKGGTTLALSAALAKAGFSVSTYLSPHLQAPNERFLDNLCPAAESELIDEGERLLESALAARLSYFEFLTAIQFHRSARLKPDIQVLEVGLGGRLDATNAANPMATCLTTIGLDHQAYLGNTEEAILEEKMGILRPNVPVFSAIDQPHLQLRLKDRCTAIGAPLFFLDARGSEASTLSWEGQTFAWDGHKFSVAQPTQSARQNYLLAYTIGRNLFPQIPAQTFQSAFAQLRQPGRFEVIGKNPRVVLSGDHNLAGIESLRESLARLPHSNLFTVCAFSPDKPFVEMYRLLQACSKRIWVTTVERLRADMPPEYFPHCENLIESAEEAIEAALAAMGPDDTLLVTGSLYLVGEVRQRWRKRVLFLEDHDTTRQPIASR